MNVITTGAKSIKSILNTLKAFDSTSPTGVTFGR